MKGLASALAFVMSLASANGVSAQGVLGQVIDWILPGVGTVADDIHGQFKELVPIYGKVEEGASALARQVSKEVGGETGGAVLAEWIRASKRSVETAGVQPMPTRIRDELRGFYTDDFLNSVRYRIGSGNEFAIPANVFRGGAVAVVLDSIVVFRDAQAAQSAVLWAHELRHVAQYREWGVDEFARQYVKHHENVEADADRAAESFRVSRSPIASSGAWSTNLASCTGDGGVKGVRFWGAQGEWCNNQQKWGTYNESVSSPAQICSCRGRGSVEGVRLWGPQGQPCGGFSDWRTTYSEQCVPARAVPMCACPGKGDKIGNHAIWGPAGKACGGFPGWGVYDQLCKIPR